MNRRGFLGMIAAGAAIPFTGLPPTPVPKPIYKTGRSVSKSTTPRKEYLVEFYAYETVGAAIGHAWGREAALFQGEVANE